jgi:hypothetical protein
MCKILAVGHMLLTFYLCIWFYILTEHKNIARNHLSEIGVRVFLTLNSVGYWTLIETNCEVLNVSEVKSC